MHPKYHFKHCPDCGNSTTKYYDDEGFIYCENCGFQFFINAASAVAAIILDNQDRILFTRRAKAPAAKTLDLPGGFVDISESAEEALEREIKEELDLELSSIDYFTSQPNTYTYNRLTYYTLDLTFICRAKDFEKLKARDDISSYIFMKPDEIEINKIGLDSIKAIVQRYRNSKSDKG